MIAKQVSKAHKNRFPGLLDATMSKVPSFLQAEICNELLFHFRRNTLYIQQNKAKADKRNHNATVKIKTKQGQGTQRKGQDTPPGAKGGPQHEREQANIHQGRAAHERHPGTEQANEP